MRAHDHPVTVVCRGQVEAINGERLALRIGLYLWPMILPEDYQPRPASGQYIQALTIPAGGRSPRVSTMEPLTIIGWSKERPPVDSSPTRAENR